MADRATETEGNTQMKHKGFTTGAAAIILGIASLTACADNTEGDTTEPQTVLIEEQNQPAERFNATPTSDSGAPPMWPGGQPFHGGRQRAV